MKSIYNPDYEDIVEWTKGDLLWPEYDWDGYVMSSNCDDLIFDFANQQDISNPKNEYLQRFFVVVLYYFVGNHYRFNKDNNYSQNRLNILLNKVNKESSNRLQRWKQETLDLLTGKIEYDNGYWFYNKLIYPERHYSPDKGNVSNDNVAN